MPWIVLKRLREFEYRHTYSIRLMSTVFLTCTPRTTLYTAVPPKVQETPTSTYDAFKHRSFIYDDADDENNENNDSSKHSKV